MPLSNELKKTLLEELYSEREAVLRMAASIQSAEEFKDTRFVKVGIILLGGVVDTLLYDREERRFVELQVNVLKEATNPVYSIGGVLEDVIFADAEVLEKAIIKLPADFFEERNETN